LTPPKILPKKEAPDLTENPSFQKKSFFGFRQIAYNALHPFFSASSSRMSQGCCAFVREPLKRRQVVALANAVFPDNYSR